MRYFFLVCAFLVGCAGNDKTSARTETEGTVVPTGDDSGTEGNPTDADGDGATSTVDCDDENAEVNPMAVEACDDGIDNECDSLPDEQDPDCWEPFDLTVDLYLWVGNSELSSTCSYGPCLDYQNVGAIAYAEAFAVEQYQSWPVAIVWTSEVPVTIPALGIDEAATEGELYFNPWQDIDIAFCNGYDCQSVVAITTKSLSTRADCVAQNVDGMFEEAPSWTASQGESYGVSNFDCGEGCAHWSGTDWAPSWACPATDQPNEDECGEYGCECNLDPWTVVSASEISYAASVTASDGVSAPWFADRWETGGMHASNDGSTVFRMYSEVSISDEDILFRPVVDVRSDWNGEWDSFPRPDGNEGPSVFANAVNEFIAPADGFWPVEWEAAPTDDDLWAQPVWNFIVKPGGEAGTANLRNLAFKACGSGVAEISCDDNGCSY